MMIYIYKVPHLHDDTIKIPRLLVNEMHVCKLATEMKLKVNRWKERRESLPQLRLGLGLIHEKL